MPFITYIAVLAAVDRDACRVSELTRLVAWAILSSDRGLVLPILAVDLHSVVTLSGASVRHGESVEC